MRQIRKPKVKIIDQELKQQRNKPLTVKFNRAIHTYAKAKGRAEPGLVNVEDLITATLAAYRMGPQKLYVWMQAAQYRWKSSKQEWVDLRKEY